MNFFDQVRLVRLGWRDAVEIALVPYIIYPGVLLRDIAASIAFFVTAGLGRASSIPARLGGKAVTLAQLLTLLAFLTAPEYLRPMAWATTAIGLYAIWDYYNARGLKRRLG